MKTRFLRLFLFVVILLMGNAITVRAAGVKSVKVGHTISVYQKNATYKSSDTAIAYVDSEGNVTGKAVGTVNISIKKGKTIKKKKINVVEDAKKKAIKVCTGEIIVLNNTVTVQKTGDGANLDSTSGASIQTETVIPGGSVCSVSITVKNASKFKGYKVTLETLVGNQKVEFYFGTVAAGKEKTIIKEVNVPASLIENGEIVCTVVKKSVVSNKMIHTHDLMTNKYSITYSSKDTTAPVISGMVGDNSYYKKMPFRVVYSNNKKYDYLKYVKVTDDRDTKVKLTVDTSKVNFEKEGIYNIIYTAIDSAGNRATATAKISVRKKDRLDEMCDEVLSRIVKPSWSDKKKAQAIHDYTRSHISYTGKSDKSDWEKEAKRGLLYGQGDCFTYYSVARALITRAGIMNIEVRRVKGHGNHWWLKVYVSGGWYHLDACPRAQGGRFNLVTDAQLKAYSKTHGNSHIWDYKNIPASPKKKLSNVY